MIEKWAVLINRRAAENTVRGGYFFFFIILPLRGAYHLTHLEVLLEADGQELLGHLAGRCSKRTKQTTKTSRNRSLASLENVRTQNRLTD